jgi:hypothetical protein
MVIPCGVDHLGGMDWSNFVTSLSYAPLYVLGGGMERVNKSHRHVIESIMVKTCCGKSISIFRLKSGDYKVEYVDPAGDLCLEDPTKRAGLFRDINGKSVGSLISQLGYMIK